MTTAITLSQFEQIDGLLHNLQNRGDLNHSAMTRDAIRSWMMHDWLLTDALVDVLGLEAVQAFPSAEACAADLVCRSLTGNIEVIDAQVAA